MVIRREKAGAVKWEVRIERRNRETQIATDRISDLPDCILLHILSFLPTKTAFLTTVLSRRWNHLCDDLQHLDFQQYHFHRPNPISSVDSSLTRLFAGVYRILSRHRAPLIRTFRLGCNLVRFDQSPVDWCVSKLLGPNLEELSLVLSFDGPPDRNVVIPHGVFSCSSLVTLRLLAGGITIPSPSSSSCRYDLPSLKTLQLYCVETSLDNLEELLSHCTALETLILDLIVRSSEGQLRICFPSLKSLHFKSGLRDTLRLLVIDTPSLKRLDIEVQSGFREIRVRNLHNVEEASINLASRSFVLKFLVELCRIRILALGLLVFDCLLQAPRRRIRFLEFTCLHRLELTVRCFDTRYIMNMLEKCRMLKVLAIVFNARICEKDPHPLRKWKHPVKVPTCLASHLQVIKIKGYFKSRDDREFFAYVLQHGLVLESLDIQVDRSRNNTFPEELSLLPRSSEACQINFRFIKRFFW